ncbi:LysR family transcriptional regulator [Pseudoalteromonas luteoviolacea]|uniref:LysR family transcriptional regulator n=1 Tax=Pseudoalteromonas luteoviolacea TaxID=43657 RepID=UPI00114DBA58|nr:LysR family transcriptional regulator [Pseudoalteromonas luteoviolacea]TQF71109.1 LysR family transcriptional regulator [Pseudoalteromonas luteoviolacea]
MDKLRAIEVFISLAEQGSFTRVAELRQTSKSMISKEITKLEESLGVRLLHRTTRALQLTEAGKVYLHKAQNILSQLELADMQVQQLRQKPQGKLKINLPMALGLCMLTDVFNDFMSMFPDIQLDIHLSDEDIDLVEHGFDLGFRASSKLLDSNYVGRPLTQFSYRICASPDYINNHPTITKAKDLHAHNCFEYTYFKNKNSWPIEDGITISGSLKVNSTPFMLEVIKAGHGIGFLPEFVCEKALKSEQVVEVLETYKKPQLTLYALYPARHFVPEAVIQCIQFLEQYFARQAK